MNFQSTSLYKNLISPHSLSPDDRRRELILNILLCGLFCASLLTDIASISNHLQRAEGSQGNSLASVLGFTLVLAFLWILSRKGWYKFSTYALLFIVWLGATQFLLLWSFQLAAVQLLFCMLVVLAGVLLTSKAAIRFTFGLALYVLLIGWAQASGRLNPDMSWFGQPLKYEDIIGFVAGLIVIGLVSWLANREIDRSLDRARRSEAALEAERDQLEVKVVERTRQLEQAQLQRVMELQRLAEFGRISAGLLHEVANPLTAASINLKQLSSESSSVLLSQATKSLHYIERFLDAARKQLKSQGEISEFVVSKEISQVLSILQHRARESAVKLKLMPSPRYRLYGDPVKFNQIVANLVLNAIEAYDSTETDKRLVSISLKRNQKWLKLIVSDNGRGLKADQVSRIFEPMYSTKTSGRLNMGIGLTTVKQIVENDFQGRISVSSNSKGTRFTLYLRNTGRT
jgi:signal transduction histidine kinase